MSLIGNPLPIMESCISTISFAVFVALVVLRWNAAVTCDFTRDKRGTSKEFLFSSSGITRRPTSAQPRSNFWELISSSSDTVSVRNLSSHGVLPARLSVETRLQKLDFQFNTLQIHNEDCRQRLLCEMAESPKKFAPLSTVLLEETSYNGDEKMLASGLLGSNDGARLLSYIEAAQKGVLRSSCDIWTYRCPQAASSMIDFKALLVWREVSKWLTVKFVAKRPVEKV